MKNFFLLITLLSIALCSSAQSYSSNKFSKGNAFYDRIDLQDEGGDIIVSVAPKFYKQKDIKKRIKPIKVGGETFFIEKGKNGTQSVYAKNGEHVALMTRNGETIQIAGDLQKYALRPKLRLANYNVLECNDSEGMLVSTTSFKNDRRLTYEQKGEQNLLLMALCIHQYQELLLGQRGKLSSINTVLNASHSF